MSVLAYYIVPGEHRVCGQLVQITLYCELEDIRPEEVFEFAEDVNKVHHDYNGGNYWAWGYYRLEVICKLGKERLIEEEALGGCSYDSPQAFVALEQGYYGDMLRQCSERIEDRIDAIRRQLIGGE